uniref:Ig-like domain-containing protein n=1 Tax=Gongylonema pulchrum TaxID=637853 RepID=A0A183D0C0_9BILA
LHNIKLNTHASSLHLIILGRPYIEKNEIQEYRAPTGQVIEIPCRVSGKPQPRVQWSVDGKPISTTGQEYEILPDNTLRIHHTNGDHTGKYVCTASNVAGQAELAAGVTVLSPPVIAPGQISYNLIQGNPITLPCEVEGEPMPKITWYVTEFKGGYVDEDGSLTIESADDLHRGQFKCVASNDVGKDEKVVTLTVHTAPTIEGSGQLKVITTNVNTSVLLACPARAFPPPSRTWSYEGDRIYEGYVQGSELRQTPDGSLEITTPQMNHAGRYTCHVSNLAGDDHITYLLK